MSRRFVFPIASTLVLWIVAVDVASANDIPRRPDGRPDLSGTYDTATLTPVERKPELGDRLYFTAAEAAEIERAAAAWSEAGSKPSDPNRQAPPPRQRRRLQPRLLRPGNGSDHGRWEVPDFAPGRSAQRTLPAAHAERSRAQGPPLPVRKEE